MLTLTIVTALKTFDLVFVMTRGGPGTETVVPGLLLYNRAFVDGRVGQSCAIAVVLAILVCWVGRPWSRIDRVAVQGAHSRVDRRRRETSSSPTLPHLLHARWRCSRSSG